jgi:hypothetical protein
MGHWICAVTGYGLRFDAVSLWTRRLGEANGISTNNIEALTIGME